MKIPFSAFHEAAKRVQRANPANIDGIGPLPCDEHEFAEAIGVELGRAGDVSNGNFTVTGFQSGDEKIDRLFGTFVDSF